TTQNDLAYLRTCTDSTRRPIRIVAAHWMTRTSAGRVFARGRKRIGHTLELDQPGCTEGNLGWQNKAYWLPDTGDVWFAATGTHTMRIQVREDGVELDQIVLSPVT